MFTSKQKLTFWNENRVTKCLSVSYRRCTKNFGNMLKIQGETIVYKSTKTTQKKINSIIITLEHDKNLFSLEQILLGAGLQKEFEDKNSSTLLLLLFF